MAYRLTRLACAALLLAAAPAVHALTALTEANPPFNFMEKGKLTGMSVEVVTAMAKRANVPLTLQLVDWNKGYNDVQAKRDTCLFSTARLPNRENVFKWVGPIATNQWSLFALDGFSGKIDKVEDARPYRIGGVDRDAKVEWLKERAVTNIVTLPRDRDIPPLLTLDRKKQGFVDLWVTSLYAAKATAAAAKVTGVKLVKTFREQELYLACNPSVPAATLQSLQSALDQMKKDGSFDKIVQPYEARFKP